MRPYLKFSIIVIISGMICAHALAGEQDLAPEKEFTLGSEIDSAWIAGMEHMYRLDFDKAENEFKKIHSFDPEHPAGDLAIAGLKWWKFSQNFDDPTADKETFEKEFTAQAQKTIEKCEKFTENTDDDNPENATYYFIMGTAYGLIGRWHGLERNWWSAYKYGTKGRKYLKKAVKLNPQIYDAYAGIGMFNYYADTLPGILKFPALFLVRGSKKKGLEQLDIAIKKGKFFSTETKIFLIEILTRYEKDNDRAIAIAREIKSKEPENPFFCIIKILTLLKSGRWQEVIEETKQFLKMYATSDKASVQQQMALVYLATGDAYVMEKRYSLALDTFKRCNEKMVFPNKAWVTLCHLRTGQIYDIFGNREKALLQYQIAYERPDMWKSQKYARIGLKRPYEIDEIEYQILQE